MKNEYFQNDVIDLRILGDIDSVCIYRFPILYCKIRRIVITLLVGWEFLSNSTFYVGEGKKIEVS